MYGCMDVWVYVCMHACICMHMYAYVSRRGGNGTWRCIDFRKHRVTATMVISIFLCFTIRFFFPSLTVFSEKLVFRYGANCILLKSQHLQWVILEVSFRSHHSAVQISLAQFNLSPHELCQLLCTQLEQVIPIRVGETPLPTADAHRNLWML